MSDFSQNPVAGRDRDGFPSFESKAMANKKKRKRKPVTAPETSSRKQACQ